MPRRPALSLALSSVAVLAGCTGEGIPPSRSADDPSSPMAAEGAAPPASTTLRTDAAPQFVAPAPDQGHHDHGSSAGEKKP